MTRAALIRALVAAAEALPLDAGDIPSMAGNALSNAKDDTGDDEVAVLSAAYALRRAKDEPKTKRAACPRCARVVSLRGKYMRDHRDALGDGWCLSVEAGS